MNIFLLAEVSAATVIGGAERVLREQARGLQERGHHVALLVRAPVHDPRVQVSIGEIPERRYAVSWRHELAMVWSSIGRSVSAFDELCATLTPDVGIIHQSLAGIGMMLFRRKRVKRWLYMCHSLAHEEFFSRTTPGATIQQRARRALNGWIRMLGERFVMRRCAKIIVLSEFMKQRVITLHRIPAERLRIIPGATDPVRFRPPDDPTEVRRSLKIPQNRVVLFAIRNLVPRMGLENLLSAIELMGEEGRDLLVLIGGEGPLRTTLERSIKDRGLTDRIQLLGFVPEDQLPMYYQAADLVLVPTYELEGFGLITVEAMACGTPVLSTPVGALPEVVARIDPALVADGSDGEALAKAIRRILRRFRDQPGEQERLAVKGRYLVETDYNWARHNAEVEGVLQEAFAQS